MSSKYYIGWKQWHEEEFGVVKPGSRFLFGQIFKPGLRKKSRVLEVGFGNGELLGYFRAQGHKISGVETNEALVKRANKLGYSAYVGAVWDIAELQLEKFDLIAAFNVVEHMHYEELNAFFLWCRNHLNEGGKLYLRFPEGASPFGLANQNGDFTHVSCLTMPKVEVLCLRSDLMMLEYYDDYLSSNFLCSFGIAGRVALRLLQSYARGMKLLMKGVFFPVAPGVRFGANSIAVLGKAEVRQTGSVIGR